MEKISIAEAKSHFSELISRSIHGHERFIITKRDNPVAAIVSLKDLAIIEQYNEREGLAAVADQWPDFDELVEAVGDLDELRRKGGPGREVSL